MTSLQAPWPNQVGTQNQSPQSLPLSHQLEDRWPAMQSTWTEQIVNPLFHPSLPISVFYSTALQSAQGKNEDPVIINPEVAESQTPKRVWKFCWMHHQPTQSVTFLYSSHTQLEDNIKKILEIETKTMKSLKINYEYSRLPKRKLYKTL